MYTCAIDNNALVACGKDSILGGIERVVHKLRHSRCMIYSLIVNVFACIKATPRGVPLFYHILKCVAVIVSLESVRKYDREIFSVFKVKFKLNDIRCNYCAVADVQINPFPKLKFISEWGKLTGKNEVTGINTKFICRGRKVAQYINGIIEQLHLNRILLIVAYICSKEQ